jgi:hypothetical protein
MLGLPSEVEEVILGRTGLLRNLAPGSIVIDMSTSRPELAVRISGVTGHFEDIVALWSLVIESNCSPGVTFEI